MDKVVHFEIPADDMERAKKFYSSIFGWRLRDMPEMKYTTVTTVEVDEKQMPKESGAINGGLMERTKDVRSPVFAIDVDSVDEYAKKVEEAGGRVVMPKTKVGDMGFYAYVTDTEGNIIGLWQNLW